MISGVQTTMIRLIFLIHRRLISLFDVLPLFFPYFGPISMFNVDVKSSPDECLVTATLLR